MGFELMKMENYIFCADDWGMSPGINEGILELARRKKLYSVSCIANAPFIEHGLEELLSFQNDGLKFMFHLNLTYGDSFIRHEDLPNLTSKTGEFNCHLKFLAKSLSGTICHQEYQKVFLHQLQILEKLNIPITGLDGHHHVHLVPGVYLAIKNLLPLRNIQFLRTMVDWHHIFTYLQTIYFKFFLYDKFSHVELFPCGYLLNNNLKKIQRKIKKHKHLITHPAKYNDFNLIGIKDKLRAFRVEQYKFLIEHCS
jgi:predicted glycoside hydrolase/deacetylase ChbG (UPF0249 family)